VLCTITASLTPRIGGADRTGGGGAPDIAAEGTTGVVLAVERVWQDIQRVMETITNAFNVPPAAWLLLFNYVVYLLNHTSVDSLGGHAPLTIATGLITDISALLLFHFWQPVVFEHYGEKFPKGSSQRLGRFVGIAEDCGDELTFLVLDDATNFVVPRSNVRAATDKGHTNLRALASSSAGADDGPCETDATSSRQSTDNQSSVAPLRLYKSDDSALHDPHKLRPVNPDDRPPAFSPEELRGRTFLIDETDGQTLRGVIDKTVTNRDGIISVLTTIGVGEGAYEEIMDYHDLCDLLQRQADAEDRGEAPFLAYNRIAGHEKVASGSPKYKGSGYNVRVEWVDGTVTDEPLGNMIADDPWTLAKHAKLHNLLDEPGWKRLRSYARREKCLTRMLKQANTRQRPSKERVYKYGVEVPFSCRCALQIDAETKATTWQDSMRKGLDEIISYETFRNHGRKKDGARPPAGFDFIRTHFVYDVKADGRRKSRLVAGGNMLDPPKDNTYAGVASLRSVRIVTFLAELNSLRLVGVDVGNAYLTARCREKCYLLAPEYFRHATGGDALVGCCLEVVKALYGLRSSGAAFHDSFGDSLRDLNFVPSRADPDVWMREAKDGTCYECIAVCVDDLLCAPQDPDEFLGILRSPPFNYILKGGDEPACHLGGSFSRDRDNTLLWNAEKCIERLHETHKSIFGTIPRKHRIPMDPKVRPELDTSPLCGADDITRFQCLLGALQWTISLCRFDIAGSVLCLDTYNVAPRENHLKLMRQIAGYLCAHPKHGIRYRTLIPDHSHHEIVRRDWANSVYPEASEDIDVDAPTPLGACVRTTTYKDANLLHNLVNGRSCTGILHFLNQTPIDWFSKRQGQVETSTYGSEFVAARIAVEQIVDLRYTLRMFGVPIEGPSWLFGDNKGVIQSSTIPHSKLEKRWCALSYHRVRESVAAGHIHFLHLEGRQNPSDCLTKTLNGTILHGFITPTMDWCGDTLTLVLSSASNTSIDAENTGHDSDESLGLGFRSANPATTATI